MVRPMGFLGSLLARAIKCKQGRKAVGLVLVYKCEAVSQEFSLALGGYYSTTPLQ